MCWGGPPHPQPTLTSGVHVVGKAFVEASYEGDFLAAARVSTAVGRESMAKYGESLAGVRPGSRRVDAAHQFRGRRWTVVQLSALRDGPADAIRLARSSQQLRPRAVGAAPAHGASS